MVRRVLHHGPYDVADGHAAHDRAGREWPREILRGRRTQKADSVCVRCLECLAGSGERGRTLERLCVFLEIEVESFRPGCALDEPVKSLRRVRDLLRDRHHAFLRSEPGVSFIKDPG